MELYSEILDAGGPAFGAIFRHARDSPNDGFLFHCTGALSASLNYLFVNNRPIAGKDRTGIAAALLLLVSLSRGVGVPSQGRPNFWPKIVPACWR